MNRQLPLVFLTMVTPLLARGSHCEPPRRQETFPHFGFLVSVETRTFAQTTGRWTTEAICAFSFSVGFRSALATATTERIASTRTAMKVTRRTGPTLPPRSARLAAYARTSMQKPPTGRFMDRAPVLETRLPGVSAAIGSSQACLPHKAATALRLFPSGLAR